MPETLSDLETDKQRLFREGDAQSVNLLDKGGTYAPGVATRLNDSSPVLTVEDKEDAQDGETPTDRARQRATAALTAAATSGGVPTQEEVEKASKTVEQTGETASFTGDRGGSNQTTFRNSGVSTDSSDAARRAADARREFNQESGTNVQFGEVGPSIDDGVEFLENAASDAGDALDDLTNPLQWPPELIVGAILVLAIVLRPYADLGANVSG